MDLDHSNCDKMIYYLCEIFGPLPAQEAAQDCDGYYTVIVGCR